MNVLYIFERVPLVINVHIYTRENIFIQKVNFVIYNILFVFFSLKCMKSDSAFLNIQYRIILQSQNNTI